MQHPTKMGRDGKPFIQEVNAKTVTSGQAAKMGYIPVSVVKAVPPPTPSKSAANSPKDITK